ncbi:hypothetical protein CBR_g863 [Chara braunii]|uniref:CTLH domain-containing protein n=1 Tax=Chara braunii TaxID=69332 RepID=A0A388KCF4_CHABU|nr:hypothetical protein CBR_g863 [Chara braunii]|eukprot:GBG67735.1 hypothetical protein CBR_g863 [Chara braunii]
MEINRLTLTSYASREETCPEEASLLNRALAKGGTSGRKRSNEGAEEEVELSPISLGRRRGDEEGEEVELSPTTMNSLFSPISLGRRRGDEEGEEDLVDVEIFLDARRVIEALQRRDCSEALAWCAENKSKLKKTKSKLEFKLRVQEFIELVRAERMMEAIVYARKHLAPWGSTNMKELQQAMATLAFKSGTDCSGYKALFDENQWSNLIEQFKQEHFHLYGMTVQSLLNIHLQAGLSALKTPFCYEDGCNKEDPLSQETFRKLAEGLPFAKHIHSKLVCAVTKELMNEDNPPLVLPNGYVYSKKTKMLCSRRRMQWLFPVLAVPALPGSEGTHSGVQTLITLLLSSTRSVYWCPISSLHAQVVLPPKLRMTHIVSRGRENAMQQVRRDRSVEVVGCAGLAPWRGAGSSSRCLLWKKRGG